jgi:hypothetical protein
MVVARTRVSEVLDEWLYKYKYIVRLDISGGFAHTLITGIGLSI